MKVSDAMLSAALCVLLVAFTGCSKSDTQTADEGNQEQSAHATPQTFSETGPLANLELTPQGTLISSGLYDMTDHWRERFGLDGLLQVEEGRRDERQSYADGPIELSFNTTPTEPGIYTFVFVLVQYNGLPAKIHAVHLYVTDGHHNESPMTIAPDQHGTRWKRTVATGQSVKVYWAGGGGHRPPDAPIGWRLSEVVYTPSTEPFQPPGIPRYEYIGGE